MEIPRSGRPIRRRGLGFFTFSLSNEAKAGKKQLIGRKAVPKLTTFNVLVFVVKSEYQNVNNLWRKDSDMNVIVIGGGASGMTAAITAARAGAKVTIFEKEDRLGRKILATGNGKCNMSNAYWDGSEYNETARAFAAKVLEKVSPGETLEFFEELGVFPREDGEGRIYPSSEQAASVLDALRFEVDRLKIEVIHEEWIKGVVPQRGGGHSVVSHANTRRKADAVIIACGGDAGRQYGCEGDGFALAEMVGHTVTEPVPALVGLTSKEPYFKQLKGVRAKGEVTLTAQAQSGEEEVLGTSRGEIQFGETGLSGICVFDLSGRANRAMKEEKRCTVRMDLFPDMESGEFLEMMRRRLTLSAYKSCENFLNGLIHKKLIPVILKQCGIDKINDKAEKITEEQLDKIAYMLKHWDVRISGSRPWNDAQTTSGGVVLSEIDENTMESKLHPGLYFAGEVVDVDGRCGGYNLQWAWSSGILAGRSAAGGAKTEE